MIIRLRKPTILKLTLLLLLAAALSLPWQTWAVEEFPLAEPGPYQIGKTVLTFVDARRDGREIEVEIWYPALIQQQEGRSVSMDVLPDTSAAPYPLILQSHGWRVSGRWLDLTTHLASHGFVVATMIHEDSPLEPWFGYIDRPVDALLVLDELAALQDHLLVGAFDADNVGVAGWAFGGYTALAMSGVQVDPDYYLNEVCPTITGAEYMGDVCHQAKRWDDLLTHGRQFFPIENEGLWPAMTDERIHAVMSAQPDAGQIYGPRGLSKLTAPVLLIGFKLDTLIAFEPNAGYIGDHLQGQDHFMLTAIEGGHTETLMSVSATQEAIYHYATAFFGRYLQNKEDYANYLTAEYVEPFEEYKWDAHLEE